ncbi:MAG: protein kinase [Myxococcota bacterium]
MTEDEVATLDGLADGPVSPERQREVEESVMAKLFGKGTSAPTKRTIGRYEILGLLGKGAMGEVFVARDPDLDREVALKVLRPHQRSAHRELLMIEARVMARLVHPNVVTVFELGEQGDQVYIAMERILGGTLRDWHQQPRPWPEVVRAYEAAARGLHAAHREGIVHRDFKPDNVLLSESNEVKVSDFGIARIDQTLRRTLTNSATLGESEEEQDRSARSGLSGTPAYMAPEVVRGALGDAHSDQFSFFVALYEALFQQRPFAGATVFALLHAIAQGDRRALPETDVPKRLIAIIERGLQTDPKRRFPSMEHVAEALGRCLISPWRRFAIPGAVALGLGVGLSAWGLAPTPPVETIEPCTGNEAALAEVWDEPRRQAISEALLRTERPYAREAQPLVDAALDDYGDQWVSMRRDACLGHLRGEYSDTQYDRRMTCFDERRLALGEAVGVLGETTAKTLPRVVNVTEGLPSLARCDEPRWLEAERAPPPPEIAAQVRQLRERLIAVQAREHAGRYAEALADVETVVAEARALGHAPTLAEAELAQGRILLQTKDFAGSTEPLHHASLSAFEIGLDTVALEALARHIHASAMGRDPEAQALGHVPFAEAMTRRFPHAAFGRALLLNNAGTAHLATGDRKGARERFERALAVKEDAELSEVELTNILVNLALLEPQADARRRFTHRAVQELEAALGPSHSMTLGARYVDSHAIADPREAQQTRAAICEAYDRMQSEEPTMRLECLYSLGLVSLELQDQDTAVEAFERLVAVAEQTPPPDTAMLEVARGHIQRIGGKRDAARARFEAVIAAAGEQAPLWVERHLARAQLGVAMIEDDRGNEEAARTARQRAADHLRNVAALGHDADIDRLLTTLGAEPTE